jgi:hypothetical protein
MAQAAKWAGWSAMLLTGAIAGALASGCDPSTYTDVNFGTNVGADYVAPAPVRDAGEEAGDVAAPKGAAGSDGGTGGAGEGT